MHMFQDLKVNKKKPAFDKGKAKGNTMCIRKWQKVNPKPRIREGGSVF
jgi:hypothetical protein